MNKLIEKYIYAVTKRCDKDVRAEIKKELEANIYDMLEGNSNPTDFEIETVLHKLGNPVLIASKYQKEDRYLVKPAFYNDFIAILKIVVPGFAGLGLLIAVFEILTTELSNDIVNIIIEIISKCVNNMISFAVIGFVLVVLLFWSYNIECVRRAVDKWLLNWKVKDLLDVPKTKNNHNKPVTRISISFELLFTIIFGLAFIILFNKYGLVGYYQAEELLEPIFSEGPKQLTLMLIVLSFLLSVIYYVIYLIKGIKSTKLLMFDTLNALIGLGTIIYFLTYPNLINLGFTEAMATNFGTTIESMTITIKQVINGTLMGLIVIVIIGYTISWIKHFNKK